MMPLLAAGMDTCNSQLNSSLKCAGQTSLVAQPAVCCLPSRQESQEALGAALAEQHPLMHCHTAAPELRLWRPKK